MNAGAEALCFTPVRISTHISRHRTGFTVFWCWPLCFCAKSGPRVDTACDLMARAWRPVSLLRAGPRTHQFSSGTLKASSRLLFLLELPAPCVNTPYIYINIHQGKKECSIISWRLMNLSRSRRSFLWVFFKRYLSCRRRLVYRKSLSLHKTNQTWCCAAGVSMS